MNLVRLKAFSLIEMAVVMSIVGLVIGGIWIAAADYNARRNYEKFLQGFVSQKDLVDRYLNQTIPCTSTMDAGQCCTFVKYAYPKLYAQLVPQEWKEISMSSICSYDCSITHFSCNADGTRYYAVAVMLKNYNNCIKFQNYMNGRMKGVTITGSCSGSYRMLNVFYEVPRY